MPSPLHHIKVVEISVAMAGPFCGMMLADYGADVVKVERVGGPRLRLRKRLSGDQSTW